MTLTAFAMLASGKLSELAREQITDVVTQLRACCATDKENQKTLDQVIGAMTQKKTQAARVRQPRKLQGGVRILHTICT